jgi:hypothetical protein
VWSGFKNRFARQRRRLSRLFRRVAGPKVGDVHVSYEKSGLAVADEPVPWNAEAVLVDAILRLPSSEVNRACEFQVRVPGQLPAAAARLQPGEEEGEVYLQFRLPPPRGATVGALYWHEHLLGEVKLPFLESEVFLRDLRLQTPTLLARLGDHFVACRAFVRGQCRRLLASGVLSSPTSLLPLVDVDLTVEFRDPSDGRTQRVFVGLTRSQLLGRQAVVSVAAPRWPRASDACSVDWMLKDRLLARTPARRTSRTAFQQSLYVIASRFTHQQSDGSAAVAHHVSGRGAESRLSPCFWVASREPGIAAVCPLEIRAVYRDPARPPTAVRQEIVVTDGPSPCLPAPLPGGDLQKIRAFELFSEGCYLGVLPVNSTPVAVFTSEGGFRCSGEFTWTTAAEEELASRLSELADASNEENSRAPLARV